MILGVALVFVGNHAFTADQLRHAMVDPLRDPAAVVQANGEIDLDRDQLARATLWLSAFYWDRGYANVTIGDPQVTDTQVTIRVDEGPRFTISSLAITGDSLGDRGGDRAIVKTRPKDVFSRSRIVADVARLSDDYGDRGYAFASIIPITHVDLEHDTIALELEIIPGERAVIDDVEVHASRPDDEAKIRRAIPIVVGQVYSHSELMDAKERAAKLARSEIDVAIMHGTSEYGVKIVLEVRE